MTHQLWIVLQSGRVQTTGAQEGQTTSWECKNHANASRRLTSAGPIHSNHTARGKQKLHAVPLREGEGKRGRGREREGEREREGKRGREREGEMQKVGRPYYQRRICLRHQIAHIVCVWVCVCVCVCEWVCECVWVCVCECVCVCVCVCRGSALHMTRVRLFVCGKKMCVCVCVCVGGGGSKGLKINREETHFFPVSAAMHEIPSMSRWAALPRQRSWMRAGSVTVETRRGEESPVAMAMPRVGRNPGGGGEGGAATPEHPGGRRDVMWPHHSLLWRISQSEARRYEKSTLLMCVT